MLLTEQIKDRIRALENRDLHFFEGLGPMTDRVLVVSNDVRDAVTEPFPANRDGARHAEFRATLDAFYDNSRLTVSEDPLGKPRHTQMARTRPISADVWDLRCVDEDQGIRCFGCFGGKDLFIALTWNYRENITNFDAAVTECREEWHRLFPSLAPFKGKTIDEYLTNYSLARPA